MTQEFSALSVGDVAPGEDSQEEESCHGERS